MSTIIEGQQYALRSQFSNKGQSMVFVKLTDSALKAIEDYAAAVSKGSVSPHFKPSIEFRPDNSQGVVSIPNKVCNADSEKQSYDFSIKDIQNDGILECIEQSRNMSMESLGKVMLRMQIHANDDSYLTTKAKMAVAAEQEHKKYNTKVIQSGDPNVGRKVKVKRHFPTSKPFGTLSNSNVQNSSSVYGKQSTTALTSMPRFSKFSNNSNNHSAKSQNGYNSFQNGNTPLSESAKRTIREHLIHLLAVRPSKLADLQLKVQEKTKESVDKGTLFSMLNGLATLRDSVFHLNESIWEEIQLDWPNYSNEDRDLVQIRNPLTASAVVSDSHNALANNKLLPSGPNANGNNISPLSDGSVRSQTSPSSLCTSPNLKHSPYNKSSNPKRCSETLFSGNGLKKLKIDDPRLPLHGNGKSHSSANISAIGIYSSPLDKLSNISDNESLENRSLFPSNSSNFKSNISLIHENSNIANKKNDISSERDTFHSRVNPYQRISGNSSGSINSTPNSSPDSGISHVGNALSSDSSVNDSDDYLSKYSKVQNSDQLLQYRNDFYAEYPEYKRLYDYVESVSRQFQFLREKILSKEEGSEEWKELIRQTIEKYDEVKHKPKYCKAQKRLNFLHYKLMHIKNLIVDYNRNHEKGSSALARFGQSQMK